MSSRSKHNLRFSNGALIASGLLGLVFSSHGYSAGWAAGISSGASGFQQCPAKAQDFIPAGSVVWRTEDLLTLVSKKPDPQNTASAWAGRHTSTIFSRLTQYQSGSNRALVGFVDRQGTVSHADQKVRLASLKEVKQTDFREGQGLARYLMQQLGKALGEHARDHSEILRALGQGLSFNVDSNGVSKSGESRSSAGQPIRYGLVLKDVRPSGKGVHVAALTTDELMMEHALRSKNKARVDWTIGPVTEQNYNPLAGYSLPAEEQGPKAQGLFALRPDFSLRGKIEPNLPTNGSANVGMKVRLEQAQGLYRMEMVSSSGVKPSSIEHELRLPIYRKLSLVRNYNEKMDVKKTSVLNVLGFSETLSLIPVNMHLVHAERLLKAETGFDWMRGRVGFETNVKGFNGLSQITGSEGHVPASYSVNYGRNF